jgi:hypothetical protein
MTDPVHAEFSRFDWERFDLTGRDPPIIKVFSKYKKNRALPQGLEAGLKGHVPSVSSPLRRGRGEAAGKGKLFWPKPDYFFFSKSGKYWP